jgi:tetratricopeptide (TPR) repeat protein
MNPNCSARRLSILLAMASVLLTSAFYAGAVWYTGWSRVHLPAMSARLGEVEMAQAARAEAAGAWETALAYYERALAGHFHGPQNRNHCEKHAGVVLLALDRPADALPYLQRAQEGPYRSLNGYRPLTEAFMKLDRWEEAAAVVSIWEIEAVQADEGLADVENARGLIAVHAGDWTTAATYFEQALQHDPNHPCAVELAQVRAEQGDLVEARDLLVAYLTTAPPSATIDAHWGMLRPWTP